MFFRRDLMLCETRNVDVRTNAMGIGHAATIVCTDYAWDNGWSHWAHFDAITEKWRAFECRGRSSRVWLKDFPTKEAAEMWLVHRGG